jgi:hypothetical protein
LGAADSEDWWFDIDTADSFFIITGVGVGGGFDTTTTGDGVQLKERGEPPPEEDPEGLL